MFTVIPSLEGWPTKAEEAPVSHEVRMSRWTPTLQNWLILHKIVQFCYLLLKYRLADLHIVAKSGILFLKLQRTKIVFFDYYYSKC